MDHDFEFVSGGEEDVDEFWGDGHFAVADEGHDVFHGVGELDDAGEAEEASGAFDAMDGAEDAVDAFLVLGVGFEEDEVVIEGLQVFFGLLDEEGEHFVVLRAHGG